MGEFNKVVLMVTILLSCIGESFQDKTFLTFNVGLTRTVPLYEERIKPVVEALKKETADVICIQEAWYGIDVNNIVKGMKSQYKYSYSDLNKDGGSVETGPACGQAMDSTFLQCANTTCFPNSNNAVENVKCMINKCSLMDLGQKCRSCMMLSEPKVESLTKDCFTAQYNFNIYGLLLLSKHPIFSVEFTDFEPNTSRLAPRGFIKAQLKGIGEIICTHLTVDLGPEYLEYNLDKFSSWKEQNLAEVQSLVNEIQYKRRTIIMGTLNTGPSIGSKSIVGDFPDSYSKLTTVGLESAYVDLVGECNLCLKNPFNAGYIQHDSIANHIMTKGYTASSARIRFTANITGQFYPLSYHYGAEVTLPENLFHPFRSIYDGFRFLVNPEAKNNNL